MVDDTAQGGGEAMSDSAPCRICQGSAAPFLRRQDVPVHQNMLFPDPAAARRIRRGDLQLVACDRCGFVANAAFDPSRLSYGPDYENSQYSSQAFREHIEELLRHLVEDRHLVAARVAEVGCGNGRFLTALVERGSGNTGIGFDPSYQGPDTALDGRVQFQRRFFGPDVRFDADAVVCRHVIEHIPDPVPFLRNIREALGPSSTASVFFETPDVEWIFEQGAFWDFFYEHCSYFSRPSLAHAFEMAGFQPLAVRRVFGGQYLWAEATVAAAAPRSAPPGSDPARAVAFGRRESQWVQHWRAKVRALQARGGVALWGAGAKGVTFANLVDPRAELVDCVVDLNPRKQAHFIAGTGHAILSPPELAGRGVATVVVMNGNYRAEVAAALAEQQLDIALVALEDR
jgi:SAM-dependent methyltransferase